MSICDFLRQHQVGFETLLHRPASSATQFAQSIHVAGSGVAKAVLVRAGEARLVAVLPATHRIDLGRLAECLGVASVSIATEDEVEGVFRDCERGAVPPFGVPYGLSTIVDASLTAAECIAFEGNTRFEGVRMSIRDYLAVESPRIAEFAAPIARRKAI